MRPFVKIRHCLTTLLSCYAAFLTVDAAAHVQHSIDVAEYEIVCESFVMSLKLEKVALSEQHADQLIVPGIKLGLDKESMFTNNFWEQHEPWLHAFALLNRQQVSHSTAYVVQPLEPAVGLLQGDDTT